MGEACRLRVTHDEFPSENKTYREVEFGWSADPVRPQDADRDRPAAGHSRAGRNARLDRERGIAPHAPMRGASVDAAPRIFARRHASPGIVCAVRTVVEFRGPFRLMQTDGDAPAAVRQGDVGLPLRRPANRRACQPEVRRLRRGRQTAASTARLSKLTCPNCGSTI